MPCFHSRRLHYLLGGFALFFILFSLLRAVFVLGFSGIDGAEAGVAEHFLPTLLIGTRFDLRLAILAVLPLILLAYLPRFNLVTSRALRLLARGYVLLVLATLMLIYFVDFGHYDYLGVRINASVFRFAGDAEISTDMLLQSYPVVWISLAWLALVALSFVAYLWLERTSLRRAALAIPRCQVAAIAMAMVLLTFVGLMGRLNFNLSNPIPLRWSDAFYSGNGRLAAIGLNPVIFLFDTLAMEAKPYDLAQVKEHYSLVADYLGVEQPDADSLNFRRELGPQAHSVVKPGEQPPNIVFVMLESLGASRVSAYGNPLNTTPNLDRLAAEGWFFERFFVPVTGTAKTVWASITGIPDVTRQETASRNPLISSQHTLINAFEEHRKLYMIGGAAGWANVAALINNSIEGVSLYEEGHWKGPNVDVWGISDLQLFREADQILREQPKEKPFFAYIQTAGNHRPFTIPEDRGDFEEHKPALEDVQQWGFRSLEQYNAVRFLDYNIGEFMKMAREGGYLDNTIFVFFGDHNNRVTQLPHMPPIYEQMWLESNHVPHIIYAPGRLQPRVIPEATSLVDMLPTVAGLMGADYSNRTMGRDIQLNRDGEDRAVPVVLLEGSFPIIGLVSKNFLLKMNYDGSEPSLHAMDSEQPQQDVSAQHPEVFSRMSKLARGTYETSRYMLYHNAKD